MKLKYIIQRIKRGWSDEDCWAVDDHLATIIAGMTKQLKETSHGHPDEMTDEQWVKILQTISEGFQVYTDSIYDGLDETKIKKFDKAMELFTKYFSHLWD